MRILSHISQSHYMKKTFEEYAKGRNKLETPDSYKDLISALTGYHFYMLDISEVCSFNGYGPAVGYRSMEADLCETRWRHADNLDIKEQT